MTHDELWNGKHPWDPEGYRNVLKELGNGKCRSRLGVATAIWNVPHPEGATEWLHLGHRTWAVGFARAGAGLDLDYWNVYHDWCAAHLIGYPKKP